MGRIIHPPADYLPISSFASPIDLYNHPSANKNRAATVIRIHTAGTITVKMVGSGGTSRTITVADGDELIGQFTSIESVSGVTSVEVGWP